MTINKSQGGTFDMVGLDATTPAFTHCQNYVALSSVKDFHNLTVLTQHWQTTINNIVFPQVFDKEYIDTQIHKHTARPILSDCFDTDFPNMPEEHSNEHLMTKQSST